MLTPRGEVPDAVAGRLSMAELDALLRRPVRRRAVLGAAMAGAAGPLLWTPPARASSDLRLGSARLAYGADPTTEMSVTFSASGAFRGATVVYGGRQDDLGGSRTAEMRAVRGTASRYGRALLTGLTPGTRYFYRIRADGQDGPTGTFHTAPATPGAFRFTAFADQGVTAAAGRAVARVAALNPAFHLVAGDLCYAEEGGLGQPGDLLVPRVWDDWFEQVEPLSARVPWMCAAGNHEMEPGFGPQGYTGMLDRLTLPGNGAPGCPATYSFRYGNVGVLALDSNDVSYEIPANLGYSGGAQVSWLERTLAGMRAPGSDIDFVVAFFHHCPYASSSAHGSEGGVREKWVPLFDRYAVDLAISGHNHCYERSMPLRGGKVTGTTFEEIDSAAGTTYLTVGGGGRDLNKGFGVPGNADRARVSVAPHRNIVEDVTWSLPSRAVAHSFAVVDVAPPPQPGLSTSMTLRVLRVDDGVELDRVTLRRPAGFRSTAAAGGTDRGGELGWVLGGGATALAVGAAGYGAAAYRRRRDAP